MENTFTIERLQRWAFRLDRHTVRMEENGESVGSAVSLALGPWLLIWARFIP